MIYAAKVKSISDDRMFEMRSNIVLNCNPRIYANEKLILCHYDDLIGPCRQQEVLKVFDIDKNEATYYVSEKGREHVIQTLIAKMLNQQRIAAVG